MRSFWENLPHISNFVFFPTTINHQLHCLLFFCPKSYVFLSHVFCSLSFILRHFLFNPPYTSTADKQFFWFQKSPRKSNRPGRTLVRSYNPLTLRSGPRL